MRTLSIKHSICKSFFVSLFWKNSTFAQSICVSTDKSTATICENSICENTILSVQILSYGKTYKIYVKTIKCDFFWWFCCNDWAQKKKRFKTFHNVKFLYSRLMILIP